MIATARCRHACRQALRAACLVFFLGCAFAAELPQVRDVTGRVVGRQGQPLGDARVTLVTASGKVRAETRTGGNGTFLFENVEAGPDTRIEVEAPGFFAAERSVSGLDALEIALTPRAIEEHVAVTALRQERELFETPQSVSVVTSEDIEEHVALTAPAALEGLPGVQVQRTDLGGGAPYLRGLIGNQVLLLVDGIPLNNSTFRLGPVQYLNTVDPFSVRRVEVVRGPSSSLYGSGGLGGVVNLITQDVPEGGGSEIKMGYDTAVDAPFGAVRVHDRFGSAAVLGGVSATNFGDLEGGALTGTQSPTGYQRRSADVKLTSPLGRGAISVLGQFFQAEDVPRYDRVAAGRDQYHFFDPQRRTLGYVQYRTTLDRWGGPTVAATLSRMDQLEGRRILPARSTRESLERDDVVTDGVGVQLTWPERRRQTWLAGAEVYHDAVESTRVTRDLVTGAQTLQLRGRFPDGARYVTVAAYGQDTVRATERLELLLGARYSRFGAKALLRAEGDVDGAPGVVESAYDASFDDLTGAAYALYRLTPHLNLTGGIAQGFRAPSLDDATIFGAFNAGWEVPNADLSPEKLTSYEVSLKAHAPRLWASMTLFDAHLEDLIERARGSYRGSDTYLGEDVYQRQNLGEAEISGAELDLRLWPTPRFVASVALATTRGKNVTRGTALQRMPPSTGRAGISWLFPEVGAWSELAVNFADKQDRLAPEDAFDIRVPPGGTPGYGVVSVGAGIGLPTGWQAKLVLENVTDTDYRVHLSGINGPGRSARVLLHRTFQGRRP